MAYMQDPCENPYKKAKKPFDEFIDWGGASSSGATTPGSSSSGTGTPNSFSGQDSRQISPLASPSNMYSAIPGPYSDIFLSNTTNNFHASKSVLEGDDSSSQGATLPSDPNFSSQIPTIVHHNTDLDASFPYIVSPLKGPSEHHVSEDVAPPQQVTLFPLISNVYTPLIYYPPTVKRAPACPPLLPVSQRNPGIKRAHPWDGLRLKAVKNIELQALSLIRSWVFYKQGKKKEFPLPVEVEIPIEKADGNCFEDTICIADPDLYARLVDLEQKNR
ncbi:hypothetical protein MDAP_001254 [Mitosporidium daphniae]|uniref:Uncharacterized protein n=1 Tax=Mitosporidium daphniae TaxID=1485682 RepID=A0A098VQ03_9MICR|nr:uncharacterized protein DI09_44p120 [Mitosporidium daphniae]KGG51108.1 hypothetical protein DI09_44p120 [Mitosporidium daphniae]|eukprot:XP_013237535.1 uncharacterized protein DI09_44p120 [Mitosporidium daphniae]